MRVNLPDSSELINREIPGRTDLKLVQYIGSGNNAQVFRAHSDSLNRDFACKVIPKANLIQYGDGREAWRQEIEKANALRANSVVKVTDLREWKDPDLKLEAMVFISDFVVGQSLRKFIQFQSTQIDVAFVQEFLVTMLELLNEMTSLNIEHGDLHEGNILVEDRSYSLTGPRFAFRVTDFGVKRITSDVIAEDDFVQAANITRRLLSNVDYQAAAPRDKFYYNAFNNDFVARHLVERDTTRDPIARNPRAMYERLQSLQFEFDASTGEAEARLISPFDFLSCEQIGDAPALLQALYSERFLGLDEIASRNNTIVTGPRGCGKSTVFKCLSLKHRVRVEGARPENTEYMGIYYRCDDLYFSFPRYSAPSRIEAVDLPCHFVTATLLSELLDVVESWSTRYFPEDFARLEPVATSRIWEAIGIDPPAKPGAEKFVGVRSELAKQRTRAVEKFRFANDEKQKFGRYFGVEVLGRVCADLGKALPYLADRPIYFFIDDYSSPKITKALQANLNRIFLQRLPSCFFKLSTESPVSYSREDIDGKIYVEGREFSMHNLGLVYLHSPLEPKISFIEDVFRRRLSAAVTDYPVKEIGQLLGSNADINFNEEARRIREGQKIELWGKETLARLCSGDIHYLIQLVREMVTAAGGEDHLRGTTEIPKIPRRGQNRAIREAAGVFLKNLRSIPKHGDQVVAIVTAFGNVAKSYLLYRDSRNEKGNPPHQASRIEPYESFELSPEAKELYDELLRYSVFIEDFRGKSRRGKVVPRLYLRRFLIPHFNLTFGLRDSVSISPLEFGEFLLKPASFEEKKRLKKGDKFEEPDEAIDSNQLELNIDDENGK